MPAASLTPHLLKALQPPPSGILELNDTRLAGLAFRLFPTGRANWTFRYRPLGGGERRRVSLGEWPGVGLAEARKRAIRLKGRVADGADPQAARLAARNAPTFAEVAERWLTEEVEPKRKPRTAELYRWYIDDLVVPRIGNDKIHAVTHSDVSKLHRKIGENTPVTANRLVVVISAVYTFAAKHKIVAKDMNPASGVEKFKEEGRERYLSTQELARLGTVLRTAETSGLDWQPTNTLPKKHGRKWENRRTILEPHVTVAVRLLLFTGCRLREILHLRWVDIDFERALLLPDSKTGKKIVVLNAPALQVLNALQRIGKFVVLGNDPDRPRTDLKKPWDLIRYHAGTPDVRIHDLRHTHASIGAGAGLGLPIIGKLLGHKHPETTQRYAHLDADPLRRASDRIGNEISAALGDTQNSCEIIEIAHQRMAV